MKKKNTYMDLCALIGTWRPSIAGSLHYDIKRLLVYYMELN